MKNCQFYFFNKDQYLVLCHKFDYGKAKFKILKKKQIIFFFFFFFFYTEITS